MSQVQTKIHKHGHWRVIIRPAKFIDTRVQYSELHSLLQKTSVEYRLSGFPHVPNYEPEASGIHRDIEWIGYESEFSNFIEAWRFYTSGQFAHRSAMWSDWRDVAGSGAVADDWQPGMGLGIDETVLRFTEIFEFASRLSLTSAGDEQMHIEIDVCNLQGRFLFNDNPTRMPIFHRYANFRATILEFPVRIDLPRAQLIADHRVLALKSSQQLFNRFGWNPSTEFLQNIQPS